MNHMKSANATVHGAISIVNAIASGNGSALGISLKVNAEVEFTEGNGITFEPKGEFRDDKLIRAVVNNAVPKKILEMDYSDSFFYATIHTQRKCDWKKNSTV